MKTNKISDFCPPHVANGGITEENGNSQRIGGA